MTSRNSSKPARVQLGSPPTDLELMLYADGELDEARAREVEAYVLRDARSRAKVAGLDVVSAAVRAREAPSLADGIADAVMARVHEEGKNGAAAPDAKVDSDLPVYVDADGAYRAAWSPSGRKAR